MKRFALGGFVLFAFFLSTASFAANSVNVTGNLKRDGYLIIDVNWVVDTAKYPVKDAIQTAVYHEIWDAVMPKLAQNMGEAARCSKSKFTRISEGKKIVKQRPDGTNVYDYNATIRFDCAISTITEKGTPMSPQVFTEGFHDGFTNEANAF